MCAMSLDLSSGEKYDLFCPVCGVKAISFREEEEDQEYIDQPSCCHVKFLYVGVADTFEYIDPDVEKYFCALREKGIPDDDPSACELLEYIEEEDPRLLVIDVTRVGVACGPLVDKIVIGFQFMDEL